MNKASKKNKKSKRKNKASKKNKSKKKSKKNKSQKKSKKAQKKKTKKSRKANKNKNKKARRKNKANKKEKKSKRKNKKAGRKNKSKKNRSKQERQGYGRDVPDTCLTTSVNILYNGLSKKASNFDRQEARVETRVPVIAKKLEKASEYNATLDYLKALNSSNYPSGDATLLTALIATLGECKPIVAGFQAEVEKCFKLNSNPTAACDCWESDSMAELEKGLKGCVIKESEQNVTDTFKECKKAVSTCNKDRVLAIPLLVNCSKTEAEPKAEATAVANNINSLNSAKAAIEKVAKSTRSAGRAAATDCVTFTALVDELVALTPDSSKIEAIAKDIAESTSVTCTATEKAALTASVTKLDTLIAEAKEKLEALQAELEAITGTTAVIATTPLITTAASSGRRRGI